MAQKPVEPLETDRLILRAWEPDDRKVFARINADPLIMEYFPRVLDEAASNRLVDRFEQHFEKHGFGFYALALQETGEFIGFVGLSHVDFDAPFTPAVEIAWRLDYAYWGKGYATEAASAVLEHAFGPLGLTEVVAYAVHDNTRAIHIMEKLGFVLDPKGNFDHPAWGKDHALGHFVLYRLSKKNFKKA